MFLYSSEERCHFLIHSFAELIFIKCFLGTKLYARHRLIRRKQRWHNLQPPEAQNPFRWSLDCSLWIFIPDFRTPFCWMSSKMLILFPILPPFILPSFRLLSCGLHFLPLPHVYFPSLIFLLSFRNPISFHNTWCVVSNVFNHEEWMKKINGLRLYISELRMWEQRPTG